MSKNLRKARECLDDAAQILKATKQPDYIDPKTGYINPNKFPKLPGDISHTQRNYKQGDPPMKPGKDWEPFHPEKVWGKIKKAALKTEEDKGHSIQTICSEDKK